MNITILGNRDLHTNRAINLLRDTLVSHTVSIFLSERVGKPRADSVTPRDLLNLQFLEHDLLCKLFDRAIARLPDREGRSLCFNEFEGLFGTPIRYDANVNQADFEDYEKTAPDLVISIRYLVILQEAAIEVPKKHGVINLHSGLLPRYRGLLSTLRALADREPSVGCTLHFIDGKKIDAGPIWASPQFVDTKLTV